MKKRIVWVVVSCVMVLGLLAASCAKAEEKAPAPKEAAPVVKEAAPVVKEAAPVVKEAAPAVKEAAPAAGAEMVKVSWKKGDGTVVEKLMEKPRYGGTATFSTTAAILAWDEAYQAPWTTGNELSHTNEELIQGEWPRGPVVTGELAWIIGGWMRESYSMGALAESWEFPDDVTAIFHIRKGVRWALDPNSAASRLVNGREFTADDAVFNIKRIYFEIKTSTMFGMAGVSAPTDVYATDKYTLVLKSPPGQQGFTWEYIADWTRMVAPEVVKKYGDQNKWENVVGTGPFMLVDYVPMSQATWKRNPNYWMKDPLIPGNQLPYLDGLKRFIIPDLSTNLAALRTGKIDWLLTQAEENSLPIIKSNPEIQYKDYPATSFSNLGFRQDKPELPFYDVRVRRALLMGINQQEIIDTYYGGHGKIMLQTVMPLEMFKDVFTPIDQLPPAPDGFDNRKMFGYYPEEAKKLLAEAGYPNGFKFSVTMQSTPAYLDHMEMAKYYWAKIGVELNLDIKEAGTFMSIYQRKTHPEALLSGRWGGDPHLGFCVRKNNMYNWAMVNVPALDDYYDQMGALYFNEPERDKVLKKFELTVINNAPYYMLPVGYTYHFWQPWIKNFNAAQSLGLANYYYEKYMWIDQELKKAMGR